jgi:type II restriction enzyme
MNLNFNTHLAQGYTSNSQIARVLTEDWVKQNAYCPKCGHTILNEFENNRPVADFYCSKCSEEFELKSKEGILTKTIADGAYTTMMARVNAQNNPNFFFLTYSKQLTVKDFLIIPKQFFTSNIIIQRPPLATTARRAGWVGCNIDISGIAQAGKIFLVKNAEQVDKSIVKDLFNKTLFLRDKSADTKGWILDMMHCIDNIPKTVFTLDDVYKFEDKLKIKYPNNNFIKDKIRQQLQVLRDKNMIEFISPGLYQKNMLYDRT